MCTGVGKNTALKFPTLFFVLIYGRVRISLINKCPKVVKFPREYTVESHLCPNRILRRFSMILSYARNNEADLLTLRSIPLTMSPEACRTRQTEKYM